MERIPWIVLPMSLLAILVALLMVLDFLATPGSDTTSLNPFTSPRTTTLSPLADRHLFMILLE
jgi:hypothetical protein